MLRPLRPDVWVKGGDYAGAELPEAALRARAGAARPSSLPYLEGRSTTSLVERGALVSSGVTVVLRALGLGDFVTGVPALALLREARPDDEIVLAARRVFAPVLPFVPSVDRWCTPTSSTRSATARPAPDLAVDLHGNGPASRDLLVPARAAAAARVLRRAPVHWRADEHEVARWQRLLVEGLGLPDAPYRDRRRRARVAAAGRRPDGRHRGARGAASASRRWPAVRAGRHRAAAGGRGAPRRGHRRPGRA